MKYRLEYVFSAELNVVCVTEMKFFKRFMKRIMLIDRCHLRGVAYAFVAWSPNEALLYPSFVVFFCLTLFILVLALVLTVPPDSVDMAFKGVCYSCPLSIIVVN